MGKALSPIIAVIIILLVTIAMAGAAYAFITTYWKGLTEKQIDVSSSFCMAGQAKVLVKNMGTGPFSTEEIRVIDIKGDKDVTSEVLWSTDVAGMGGKVLELKFDEEDGKTVLDSSGKGNHGTLYTDAILMMKFDESEGDEAKDSTAYENDGNLINSPARETSGCRDGNCLRFYGNDWNDRYVYIPYNPVLNTGNKITVSVWIKTDEATATMGIIVRDFWNEKWKLYIDGGGVGDDIHFVIRKSDNINIVDTICEFDERRVADNKWHHIVGTFDGSLSSERIKLYYDGQKCGSKDGYDEQIPVSEKEVVIGKQFVNYFNGLIDEVAIYKKALTDSEISELFNAGRAKFLERVDSGVGGKALEFDGAGDYVEILNSGSLDFTDSSYSWGAWYKPKSLPPTTYAHNLHAIICRLGYHCYLGFNTDSKFYDQILLGSLPSLTSASVTSSSYTLNNWYHIMAVVDDGNKQLKLYVNGELVGTKDYSGTLFDYNSLVRIGTCSKPGSNWDFVANGIIDDVRIYDRVLSEEEIQSLAGKALEVQPGKTAVMSHSCEGVCRYSVTLGQGIPRETIVWC